MRIIFMQMARKIRYLLGLLFLTFSHAAMGQIQWERNWGAVWEDVCEVRILPDSGIVMLASIDGVDTWLVRLDRLGDTLWSKRITFADFCTVQPTLDGGYFLGGTTRSSLREEVAYRVDPQGDSLWAYVYPDSIDHGVYTSIALPNSNFLLTGYSRRNNYDMWARLIDETGLSLWAGTYGTALTEFGALPAVCADGGFLFSTTQNNPSPEFFLVRVNELGQVLWTRNLNESNPIGGAVPTALPDGGFLLSGWMQKSPTNYDSYLMRIDSAGNRLWSRTYGGMGFEERSAKGAIVDLNGGYTFTTMTQGTFGPDEDRDIALLRLDTAGLLVDEIRIGRDFDDVPRYFAQTPDSQYVVLGYTRSFVPTAQQVYLVKVGLQGCNAHFYWPGFPEQDTLCPGDSATLDAGAGFASYLWSNGDTGRFSTMFANDTVFVAATDAQGCIHYSNYFRGSFAPSPAFGYSFLSGNVVTFDLVGGQQGTWDFGDGSPPVTAGDVTHTFSAAGVYAVCYTEIFPGCGPFTVCDSVTILLIGAAETGGAGMRVYPNPARAGVHVSWPGHGAFEIEVWDVLGRRLWVQPGGEGWNAVSLPDAAGVYWVRTRADSEMAAQKVIRN